ncbi:hypothetical protein Q31a_54190 [Aureliella helgolandensis]|uniref:Polysaccharide lyase n=1 Tax=Aureliella helgolandensis TaxID=2527968 RepID=A0A518GEQ9_9BACT|nr:hypothetical protein Q31a_54190 [Aureliella helgolandensis]
MVGLVALVGCGPEGSRQEEEAYLRTIMSGTLIPYSHLDVPSRDNVKIVLEKAEASLALRLFPGQPKLHGGIRAEVSVDFPFSEHDSISYSWRFKFDETFVSDTPENRWWVIGQWHDQPDANQSETWENFRSHSPPVSLGIGEVDGTLALALTHGPTRDGLEQISTEPVPIERGVWYKIETRIHWSQISNGRVEVLLNDFPEASLIGSGPNMNNAYRHYLKVGMYRHPEIESENQIYIDDLSVSEWNGG